MSEKLEKLNIHLISKKMEDSSSSALEEMTQNKSYQFEPSQIPFTQLDKTWLSTTQKIFT